MCLHVMCLKGLIAAAFESSEPLRGGLMDVSAPSLHRESTDSLIRSTMHKVSECFCYVYVDIISVPCGQ